MNGSGDKKLFWACFTALIATAFGFIVRAMIMDDWKNQFGLTETQKGEIFGVGLWPFAISIVIFSLIIDKIGYGKAMVFAFFCHVISMVVTIATPSIANVEAATTPEAKASASKLAFWMLYIGNFIVALGNGTVEAVINPVVATMFNREKTKWLNILHAGWPGGLVLGGILALSMGSETDWRWKVGLLAIPVLGYGLVMLTCKFPVNERVSAGVSYKDMLKEIGFLGALVVLFLILSQLATVAQSAGLLFVDSNPAEPFWNKEVANVSVIGSISQKDFVIYIVVAVLALVYGIITMSLGRILFFFLLCIMMPLAITELGTDSWITSLMEPEMKKLNLNPGLILVYTSFIMMVLRFFAGPIVHAISPLGLLAVSSALAIAGLFSLSYATGVVILLAATLYGFGKTFFWPTMLGVVAERFPKGGAMTLNTISGVGMLAVGILGGPLLGNIQDKAIDQKLAKENAAIHAQVMDPNKKVSVFGEYQSLDADKVKKLSEADQAKVTEQQEIAKKEALRTVALFPVVMLVSYLLLIVYFKMQGGYKQEHLDTSGGSGGGH